MTKQRLIAEFEKNAIEKVKVHLQEFKGQAYVDFRVFFSDEEKTEHATKKGICLNVELLGELKAAIDAAVLAVDGEDEILGELQPAQ